MLPYDKNKKRIANYLSMVCLLLLPALLLIGFNTVADGTRYYRYKNDSGVIVIDDHIPPEFVANGYAVLGAQGEVIKVIARTLTATELREQNTTFAQKIIAERKLAKQQQRDYSLLRRYSSMVDIEASRSRRLKDLSVRISILKGNLLAVKSKMETEQSKAANMERRGIAVPKSYSDNIEALRNEIHETELLIVSRDNETVLAKKEYLRDIQRFKILLDNKKARGHYLLQEEKSEEEQLIECLIAETC